MKHEDINIGDKVVYIPNYHKDKMVEYQNLGVVTSKNDNYIFVMYKDKTGSQATRSDDLFSIKNRPDLVDILDLNLIGKTVEEAKRIVDQQPNSKDWARVICENGKHYATICDLDFNRINLTVEKGVVTSFDRG